MAHQRVQQMIFARRQGDFLPRRIDQHPLTSRKSSRQSIGNPA